MTDPSISCVCETCKSDLSISAGLSRHGDIQITVEPCERCIEAAKDQGAKEAMNG